MIVRTALELLELPQFNVGISNESRFPVFFKESELVILTGVFFETVLGQKRLPLGFLEN